MHGRYAASHQPGCLLMDADSAVDRETCQKRGSGKDKRKWQADGRAAPNTVEACTADEWR